MSDVQQSIPEDDVDQPMSLIEHLTELRNRLMITIAAVFVGFVIAYWQAEKLFGILLEPLRPILPDEQGQMIFTGLTEPFLVYIKTGLLGGVFLATPVIFMQIWLFIRPAFRGEEKKYAGAFVFFGSLLFMAGACFGYFLVFPFGFSFLIQFAGNEFLPFLTIREYFSLATKMLLGFGIMFETPLALLFFAHLGAIDAAWLRRNRKYALLVIFVVAAMLTPPDVFTQLMLAAPLIIMYEMSIFLVALVVRKKTDATEPNA